MTRRLFLALLAAGSACRRRPALRWENVTGALFRFVVVVLVVAGCAGPSARFTIRDDGGPEITRIVDVRQCEDAARRASDGEQGKAWAEWYRDTPAVVGLIFLPVPIARGVLAERAESTVYRACMEARGYQLD